MLKINQEIVRDILLMGILKTRLDKETFKIALDECIKKAWIWHNQENFEQMKRWQKEKKFLYLEDQITEETEFDSSGETFNLFETYKSAYSRWHDNDNNFEIDEERKNWFNEQGFSLEEYESETIIDGNLVGKLARNYFELINQKNQKPLKIKDFSEEAYINSALAKTKAFLSQANLNEYQYLFEAAFEYDNQNLKTRCDILKLKYDNHVEIIEIKATSKIKSAHFFDLAYQIFILEKNGFIVDQVYIGHLKENYILGVEYSSDNLSMKELSDMQFEENSVKISYEEAEKIVKNLQNLSLNFANNYDVADDLEFFFDIDPLFKKTRSKIEISLIEAYRLLENYNLELLFAKLANIMASNIDIVEKSIMNNSFCNTRLAFKSVKNNHSWHEKEIFCFHVVPWFDQEQETIFNLTGFSHFSWAKKAEIYWKTGYVYLKDINSLETIERKIDINKKATKQLFSEVHYRHFHLYKNYLKNPMAFDLSQMIDGYEKPIKKILHKYQNYPIYMYDFETARWAIPQFQRSKSYQQIPFQYSIDVLTDGQFDYNNPLNTMVHYDFLESKQQDPRLNFLKKFLNDIFSCGEGVYVAYNDSFEKSVLKCLAWTFPEYKIPLYYIIQNTIDLMDFFKGRKGVRPWFCIYHPKFHGSYSIKKTQPALDPEFSYSDLRVNKGDKASELWRRFYDNNLPDGLWKQSIYQDMLIYCNRDTLAMVVILQKVQEIYNKFTGEI